MANSTDFWSAISPYSSFLITSHIRPDVDAVGSEIALALFMEKLGCDSRIVNDSPLPDSFTFLPRNELVLTHPKGMDFPYDALLILDAPDTARAGAVAAAAENCPIFIIDHHPYENSIVDFAWIDPSASSTGELLYRFMEERRELIDADIARCLYAAIMTDTGRFMYANTSPRTLETAASLAALGASPHEMATEYYENVGDGFMRILAIAAAGMTRAAGGAVAYTTLSQKDFERAHVGQEAATQLAELPRSLDGVRIGALLREMPPGTKVSLRSKGDADVKAVAEHFGGGGHYKASGFFLELPLAEAEIVVVRFLEEYLGKPHG